MSPEPKENEGREPEATVLSARDLSCSDQLKPWSGQVTEDKSEVALGRVRGAEAETGFAAAATVVGEVVEEKEAALMLPLRCWTFAAVEAIASHRDEEPDAGSAVGAMEGGC